MSIFRRDSEEARPPATSSPSPSLPVPSGDRRPQPAAAGATTHIASGAKITGQVNGSSDLLIDGELEGQVQLESHVTVGTDGRVVGDISARTVRIGGKVTGNVHGSEKVEILPTGRLEGDVAAPRVVLAEGAFFKGKVEMTGGQGGSKAPAVVVGAKKREEGT
jgi:cytoskeletal protein CcmA (bactofilin family)